MPKPRVAVKRALNQSQEEIITISEKEHEMSERASTAFQVQHSTYKTEEEEDFDEVTY